MIRFSNKKTTVTILSLLMFVLGGVSSCKKESNNPDSNTDFDQQAMLTNYADHLIIPSYQAVVNSLEEMKSATALFEQNYSVQQLEVIQQKWTTLYSDWLWASVYSFGPAGESGITKRLVEEVSTFPVDTLAVNSRVASNDTSFTDFKRDARGLLAIEYMIFSMQETNAQVVAKFQNDANRIGYLKALINKVQKQIGDVHAQWTGSYRSTFIENTGTSVGSSVSMLYNEFVRSYEAIKNFKLGIPLGKKAGQASVEPYKVEALFSANSLKFIDESITVIEHNWLGKSRVGQDGLGWKEYIESATGGADLVGNSQTQQANIANVLSGVNQGVSMFTQINTNTAPLDNLYTELQKLTRFYKSDLSSLLGISITFTDADGD